MTNALTWFSFLPTIALLAGLLTAPGYLFARVIGLRRYLSFFSAAPLTMALVALSSLSFHFLNIGWNLTTFTASYTVALCWAVLLRLVGSARWLTSVNNYPWPHEDDRQVRFLSALIVSLAGALPPLGSLILSNPTSPSSQADPMFHYAVVNAAIHTADASNFGAASLVHGPTAVTTSYPWVWHAFISLLGTNTPIVPASHALAFIVLPPLWAFTLWAFYRLLLPHSLSAVAVLLSVAATYYPDFMTVSRGYWPNALAFLGVPAAFAAAILIWRTVVAAGNWRASALGAVWFLALLAGTGLTHPGPALSLVVTLLFPAAFAATALWRQRRARPREQRSPRPTALPSTRGGKGTGSPKYLAHHPCQTAAYLPALKSFSRDHLDLTADAARPADSPPSPPKGGSAPDSTAAPTSFPPDHHRLPALTLTGFTLLALAMFSHPTVRAYLHRRHPRPGGWEGKLQTFHSVFGAVPLPALVVAALVILMVVTVFVVVLARGWRGGQQWLVAATAFHIGLVAGAYFPGIGFTAVAGWWYHDPKRIMVMVVMLASPILTAQLFTLMRSTAWRLLVVGATLLLLGVGLRVGMVYPQASTPIGEGQIIKSPAHLESLQSFDQVLPPGSIVLGDPVSGLGYAPAYGDVTSVFGQVNRPGTDTASTVLAEHFNQIHSDPRVCEVVRHYGIGYFYQADSITFQRRERSQTWPGLYGVDTSNGFTLMRRDDGGSLWRIDACGPVEEDAAAHWWDLSFRSR
ncbi:MAG: hypothetical protein Q4P06_09030 [Actinomycetaceae bacterium]|nr:hypothetical protein [Actinomycetaceae bacterium]